MDVRKAVRSLEAKLAVLNLNWNTSENALEERDVQECKNQMNLAEKKFSEIRELIADIQEGRIIAGEDLNHIEQWGIDTRDILQQHVLKYGAISNFIDEETERERSERVRRGFERVERERELLPQGYEQNLLDAPGSRNPNVNRRAKLPKIEVSKFDGDILDYFRFWSTFSTDIDDSSLPETSKFSYLKELLTPKVRYLVDGLPFTADGYERAKEILKQKFGQESEIISAHVSKITNLAVIRSSNPSQIQEFYEVLVRHVQALETMDRLNSVNGYTRTILDRLPGIRADLVRDDENWKNWEFPDLVCALRRWTERNPVDSNARENQRDRDRRGGGGRNNRDHMLNTGQRNGSTGDRKVKCVYCSSEEHKSQDCSVILAVADRKKLLSENKLCFNCTGSQHKANQCSSKKSCQRCNRRHHTSICEKGNDAQPFMLVREVTVVYPVVVVKIKGVMCRALLDSAAGSSYVSQGFLDYIEVEQFIVKKRLIQMMFSTQERNIKVYSLDIHDVNDEPVLESVSMTKVERHSLLSIPNPRYSDMRRKYKHLSDLQFFDSDEKDELPIHVILGVGEVSKSKTSTSPRIGNPGDPIAELTKFGWVMMSPGSEEGTENMMMTQNSIPVDFDQLSRLDVLGIEDAPEGCQKSVYDEFEEQLERREDGHYETGLIWKLGHDSLPPNEHGSLKRLHAFLRKNQGNPELLERYDALIRSQIDEGIVERVPNDSQVVGPECYLPHRPVVRTSAESTKIRQVCDASARANANSPSLNECLETGPPLQNLLWDVILRTRFKPIVLCGDLKKAFLQIYVRESERDALRFHWVKSLQEPGIIEVLRFTRVLFGLNQSPFILGATLQHHLQKCSPAYGSDLINEIMRSLYVDDLIKGLETVSEGEKFKEISKVIFSEAGFTLHKWHSNVASLEENQETTGELTFARETFGSDERQTKLLGLMWDKAEDSLSVTIPEEKAVTTKRGILSFLAAIYDPLGVLSPVILVGKCVFRDCCESKLPWDKSVTGELLKNWQSFVKDLPRSVSFPRALVLHREEISFVDLHVFADASKIGTGAVTYAVIHQPSGVSQGIVAAKSRISKKTTIPRLELIGAVMAANLLKNVRNVLSSIDSGVKVRKEVCWSDSTTVIHWIRGDPGRMKQFVRNHCNKILEKTSRVTWRHVPGIQNPADIASRGAVVSALGDNWWKGPEWLQDEEKWPVDIQTKATADTEAEAKLIKEVLNVAVTEPCEALSNLVEKFQFKKVIRITAWMKRFARNSSKAEPLRGPLSTEEIRESIDLWIKKTQAEFENDPKFEKHQKQFNLQKNEKGIYICVGRVQGHYPIYLPTYAKFTEILVQNAHLATLHGGVGLTLTRVRESYWIPRLRQLTKRIRSECYGCKRLRAMPLSKPKPADLPTDRTDGDHPFQVIGLDFAGPIIYKKSAKTQGKAYIIIYTCSLTRAVCLELLPDQTLTSFVPSLKRMMARRGRPEKIYSDNFSTFVSASKWLKNVIRNEAVHDYLASNEIKWQFNLSRAPWWGGQFERMVSLVKQSLYKVIGKALLSKEELEEVLLDVELCLNNRPLSYVEDDHEMPILTPNVMSFGQRYSTPDEDPDNIGERDLRKRAQYIQRCKNQLWKRWSDEYLRSLRERHDQTHREKGNTIEIGDVMMIKGDERVRAKWKIGIVTKLIIGKDKVVRGAKLRAGKDHLERAVQHLYPLELNCDRSESGKIELSPKAEVFRPRRNAAIVSEQRTRDVFDYENSVPEVEW